MTTYRPVFQDQVNLNLADGLFLVFAKNEREAKERIERWLKKLDIKDKRYFTGCQYPNLYQVDEYPVTEEGIVLV